MKYMLKHKKVNGSILLTYNEDNRVVEFSFNCDITTEIWEYIISHFPCTKDVLETKFYKNFEIILVHTDLSFMAFWDLYNLKVGNKKRTEKLYNALTEHERVQAFAGAKRYANYLALKPNQDKCYPETFLSQRRWENSFNN